MPIQGNNMGDNVIPQRQPAQVDETILQEIIQLRASLHQVGLYASIKDVHAWLVLSHQNDLSHQFQGAWKKQ